MTALAAAVRLLGATALLFSAHATADVAVPPLAARVTDLTATLNSTQRQALEQKLAEFEARKGSQLAVLIVPTTRPETIEQYSIRVAEQWKPGRKGVDDGAILLVARDDHALRIEVGYGLEGALTDATSNRIISEVIVPLFKRGDFYGGINAGVDKMIGVIDGEPLPPPNRSRYKGIDDYLGYLPYALFLILAAGAALRTILGRIAGAAAIGTLAGLVTWAFTRDIEVALVVAAIVYFFSSLSGGTGGLQGWSTPGRYGSPGGGWGTGGFGGTGGLGSGGFSGGGGNFGGGGASGRW